MSDEAIENYIKLCRDYDKGTCTFSAEYINDCWNDLSENDRLIIHNISRVHDSYYVDATINGGELIHRLLELAITCCVKHVMCIFGNDIEKWLPDLKDLAYVENIEIMTSNCFCSNSDNHFNENELRRKIAMAGAKKWKAYFEEIK